MNVPPRTFGMNGPNVLFQASAAPPIGMSQVSRPSILPSAPGLPQRPSFGAPTVNAFQLQQMHQGHVPSQLPLNAEQTKPSNGIVDSPSANGTIPTSTQETAPIASQIPDATIDTEPKSTEATTSKKGKKEKERDAKLVYSDNNISPEEKLSRLARYAFNP